MSDLTILLISMGAGLFLGIPVCFLWYLDDKKISEEIKKNEY